MYITYESAQWAYYGKNGYDRAEKFIQPPRRIPAKIPQPDDGFMPSILVRTCDMKTIPGHQVNEGYCTLSYTWSQSGEIEFDKKTGKSKRKDQGKHVLVTPKEKLSYVIKQSLVKRKHQQQEAQPKVEKYIIDDYANHIKYQKMYVYFEDIIQHICQQFNIQYIWYDQMCINQNDKKEKQKEIRQMHQVYSNAYCTVVLLPEIQKEQYGFPCYIHMEETKWFKRLWTLEEAIKSKQLLMVGQNAHVWGDEMPSNHEANNIMIRKPFETWTMADVLFYAHIRSSTNDHDRVYALGNLFPEVIAQLEINDDQPLKDFMVQFYGHLGRKDISILHFKRHFEYQIMGRPPKDEDGAAKRRSFLHWRRYHDDVPSSEEDYYEVPIQKFQFLPSWTGVNGEHHYRNKTVYSDETKIRHPFQEYTINGRTMRVTCEALTNDDDVYSADDLTLKQEDLPPFSSGLNDDKSKYSLGIWSRISGQPQQNGTQRFYVSSYDQGDYCYEGEDVEQHMLHKASEMLGILSKFIKIQKKNLYWYPYDSNYINETYIKFGGLTEEVDYCSFSPTQYVLLTGISFDALDDVAWRDYPVIKKNPGEIHYTSIGTCSVVAKPEHQFSNFTFIPRQTFLIE